MKTEIFFILQSVNFYYVAAAYVVLVNWATFHVLSIPAFDIGLPRKLSRIHLWFRKLGPVKKECIYGRLSRRFRAVTLVFLRITVFLGRLPYLLVIVNNKLDFSEKMLQISNLLLSKELTRLVIECHLQVLESTLNLSNDRLRKIAVYQEFFQNATVAILYTALQWLKLQLLRGSRSQLVSSI